MNSPPKIAENMDYIQKLFLQVRAYMRTEHELEELINYLDTEPPQFRSVAYESASFEIGLRDISLNLNLNNWIQFNNRSATHHSFHIEIGLGWSFANLKIPPQPYLTNQLTSTQVNQYTRTPVNQLMLFDGMGYYNALFNGRKTIKDQLLPSEIDLQGQPGFDQGLGRRLWYNSKGDVDQLGEYIHSFPMARQADLWRGVGIACGYVGGNDRTNLEKLLALCTDHKNDLRTGLDYAMMSRKASDTITADLELACEIFYGKSLKPSFS